MKKKPPPGATLIARLKEKRLQREQSPAQGDESGPVLDVEAQEVEPGEKTTRLESHASAGVEIAIREPQSGPAADLFQSSISINDLRPSTDDYEALTEEIRMAGRFAAIGLIAQGLRLAHIRHAEIHRNHFSNFEDYCRNEHQMSATYAYRLIRMAEMAEKFAERPRESLSGGDPYESMLSLGHRHLMALLPLPEEKVEEFLVKGVPLQESGEEDKRVPIDRATEKQIKQALKSDPSVKSVASMSKRAEKMLTKELPRLVDLLEQCAEWLGTSPAEMELAKMEKAAEIKLLAERFKTASQQIYEALQNET